VGDSVETGSDGKRGARSLVEIVHEAKWILDGGTVGGRIVREVEGGFNKGRWNSYGRGGWQDARAGKVVNVRTWGAACCAPTWSCLAD